MSTSRQFLYVRPPVGLPTPDCFEQVDQRDAALVRLTQWYREGRLKHRETVAVGLESAPSAFINMLEGKNLGKQVVRLS